MQHNKFNSHAVAHCKHTAIASTIAYLLLQWHKPLLQTVLCQAPCLLTHLHHPRSADVSLTSLSTAAPAAAAAHTGLVKVLRRCVRDMASKSSSFVEQCVKAEKEMNQEVSTSCNHHAHDRHVPTCSTGVELFFLKSQMIEHAMQQQSAAMYQPLVCMHGSSSQLPLISLGLDGELAFDMLHDTLCCAVEQLEKARLDAETTLKRIEAEAALARAAAAQTEATYKSDRAAWVTSLDAQKFEVGGLGRQVS